MVIFSWDIFMRVLETLGIALGGLVIFFTVPAVLKFFFRRVTGIEKDYEAIFRERRDGNEYVEASYFRTNFFLVVYSIIRFTVAFGTLMAITWVWHDDLWYIMLALGGYALLLTLHLGDYVRNAVAYVWIITSGKVKLGQTLQVANARGVVVDLTAMHVVLYGPTPLHTLTPTELYHLSTVAHSPQPNHLYLGGGAGAITRTANKENSITYVPNGNFITYDVVTTDVHYFYPHIAKPEGDRPHQV